MIYKNIHLIKKDSFRNKRIICIDFGTKKLGIAISDINQKIANPWINIIRSNINEDIAKINNLLEQNDTNLLLLGLPRNLDGSDLKTTQQVRSFANLLVKSLDTDIFYWDERYSSKAASDITKHKKASDKQKEDKLAATIILQGFLDFISC